MWVLNSLFYISLAGVVISMLSGSWASLIFAIAAVMFFWAKTAWKARQHFFPLSKISTTPKKPSFRDTSNLRSLQILIESLVIIHNTKDPKILDSRFRLAQNTILDLYTSESDDHYGKLCQFAIYEHNQAYNRPIDDIIIHIITSPTSYSDTTILEDIILWPNISRCYKELAASEILKISELKTKKGKINRLEKLKLTLEDGISKMSLAGDSHPNYFDLYSEINRIDEQILELNT